MKREMKELRALSVDPEGAARSRSPSPAGSDVDEIHELSCFYGRPTVRVASTKRHYALLAALARADAQARKTVDAELVACAAFHLFTDRAATEPLRTIVVDALLATLADEVDDEECRDRRRLVVEVVTSPVHVDRLKQGLQAETERIHLDLVRLLAAAVVDATVDAARALLPLEALVGLSQRASARAAAQTAGATETCLAYARRVRRRLSLSSPRFELMRAGGWTASSRCLRMSDRASSYRRYAVRILATSTELVPAADYEAYERVAGSLRPRWPPGEDFREQQFRAELGGAVGRPSGNRGGVAVSVKSRRPQKAVSCPRRSTS